MNENKAIETLLNMYENIENELLVKIASHFSINDEFINSDYWKIKKLDEMGLFNEDIVDYIAKYSNKTTNEVKKALEKIGYNSLNFDNLNNLFKDGILKINPDILMKNDTITNIVKFAYNDLNNRFIEMSKKIEEATKDAYLNVVEQAYLKTSMGTHSYQESIREAINELSNKGIRTLTYQTTNDQGDIVGLRSYNIEGMVRREVLTASRQLSNNISLEVANELNCEYLYLSEHVRCRPSHFDWQGTIIKKDDLVKITDYGSVTGLGGPNCGHYAEPYFGDSRGNDLKSISKEDAEKQYELSQKQRYLENGIKKWKRKREMFKASDDKEYYSKCKEKVKEWQNKAEKFTQDNNLRRDYTREYIASKQTKDINITTNLNNSKGVTIDSHKPPVLLENLEEISDFNINRMLKKYENIIKDDKIENAIVITKEGKVYQCFGNETNVWPDIDLGDEIIGSSITHNHPKAETNYSFSPADINLFNKYNLSKLRGIDDKYVYELDRNGKPTLTQPTLNDIIEDNSIYHIQAIDYSIKNNISYKRWKND